MASVSMNAGRKSFWSRQFDANPTVKQSLFDVFAGVILPLGCLIFDPIVFRDGALGRALLGRYLVIGYCTMGISLFSLGLWLSRRRPAPLLSGLMFGGAAFAVGLGLVLLPFSFIGLFMLIGVLGLAPFVTALSYWRNAVRAWHVAQCETPRIAVFAATIGFLSVAGLPALLQASLDKHVDRVVLLALSLNDDDVAKGITELRQYRHVANFDQIVWAYLGEADAARRMQLAQTYNQITGDDIENRLLILID